jgi:hypothetical protein
MNARAVQRVLATVSLEPTEQLQSLLDDAEDHIDDRADKDRLAANLRSPENLRLQVALSVEDTAGQLTSSDRVDFGLGLQRRGVSAIYHRYHGPPIPAGCDEVEFLQRNYRVGPADIEDAINQMLGRDPDQHRPPRLAWGNLIAALTAAGLTVSEADLIAAPLAVVLTPEVEADLDQA